MTKLTLSADEEIVKTARRLARGNRTSISAMFARMVLAAARQEKPGNDLPPIVTRASGIIRMGAATDERELLQEALLEKYRMET